MATPAHPRIDAVDIARGVAIIAMVFYHFAWDLGFLGFIAVDVAHHPVGLNIARVIAGSFLLIAGISLVLADKAGQGPRRFWGRVGKIGLAALAITAGTWFVFPDAFIYFGILHMIAVGSILALPFLRMRVSALLAIAIIVLIAPQFVAFSAFDSRWLAWTGFAQSPPMTLDFEPVFPWFAVVLTGVAAGRFVVDHGWNARLAQRQTQRTRFAVPARWLAVTGRWSLVIYLLHQPFLLGVLYPVALVTLPPPPSFVDACIAECMAVGSGEERCRSACTCTAEALERNGFDHLLTARRIGTHEQELIDSVARACFRNMDQESP